MIDLQLNGAFGVSCRDGPDAVAAISTGLAARGIERFCPTLSSASADATLRFLSMLEPGPSGAHLEGPFLNPAAVGAHDPQHLRPIDAGEVAEWLAAGPPAIVTLAPELPGATGVIEQLTAAGVVCSLGHSHATYNQAARGFDAGARMATHLFNAMSPLHHRAPGISGCALDRDDVIVSVIGDGVHVADPLLRLVFRVKPAGRVVLVSDAVATASAAVRRDGGLAGSTMLLDEQAARLGAIGVAAAAVVAATTQAPLAILEHR